MAISNFSLFWTKSTNFGPKNAEVIKNMLKIQKSFKFYESSYRVLVACQKVAVKSYPIKS